MVEWIIFLFDVECLIDAHETKYLDEMIDVLVED